MSNVMRKHFKKFSQIQSRLNIKKTEPTSQISAVYITLKYQFKNLAGDNLKTKAANPMYTYTFTTFTALQRNMILPISKFFTSKEILSLFLK